MFQCILHHLLHNVVGVSDSGVGSWH